MIVESLRASGFRNLSRFEIALDPGITLIFGKNGQGKTNLLEAAYASISHRSFRTSDLVSLINENDEYSRLESNITLAGGRRADLVNVFSRSDRDRVQLNNRIVKGRKEFDRFPVVAFVPGDVELSRGAPSIRRDFLDGVGAYVTTGYSSLIASAERLLRQRQTLIRSSNPDITSLDVFDSRYAEVSEQVAMEREAVVAQLDPIAGSIHRWLSGGEEKISICYRRSWEGSCNEQLFKARKEDIRKGTTSYGCHRDDLALEIDGRPMRSFGSQGQARSFAFSLKLAAANLIEKTLNETPVVILDDIFSELDEERVARLLDGLPKYQILISHTTIPPVGLEMRTLEIRQGVVRV